MTRLFYVAAMIMCAGLFISCDDKTLIGEEIVGGEAIDYEYRDDLAVRARTIVSERLATYRNPTTTSGGESSTSIFMLGEISETFFGDYASELYLETSLRASLSLPDTTVNILDSLILVLDLDTLGRYGDTSAIYDIDVFRVAQGENLDEIDTIYADQSFMTDMRIGGRSGYRANYIDSIEITSHSSGEATKIIPQLRIPIDNAFAEFFISDDEVNSADSTFKMQLPAIKVAASTDQEGFIGLNLLNPANATGPNMLRMYYTIDDTIKRVFDYSISGVKSANFIRDIAGSSVEAALGDFDNAEFLYIQGMQGPNIEFDLASLDELSDKLLNKVELELYVAEMAGDDLEFYSPVPNIVASQMDEEGELSLIEDLQLAIAIDPTQSLSRDNLEFIFGGNLTVDEDMVTIRKYNMNLTNYVKSIYRGENDGYELILSIFGKSETPSRSIIFGPDSGTLAPKLSVLFTEI